MKVIVFCLDDLSHKTGVRNKIFGQVEGFQDIGIEVYLIYINNGYLRLFNPRNTQEESVTSINGYLDVLVKAYSRCVDIIIEYKPDIIYLRSPFIEFTFLRFLKKVNKTGSKVVLEFPTFPYDHEYKSKTGIKKYAIYTERFFRKYLSKYVDYTVTYTDHNEIYNIPALKINNGINPNKFPLKGHRENRDSLNLIAVANLSFWHGYDRVVEGIKVFKDRGGFRETPINFQIVGSGNAKNALTELVNQYNLQDHIGFPGQLEGKELDQQFNNADIAIEVLGMHRRGYNEAASLKAREYCCRGIPFVSSVQDTDFSDSLPFVLKVPANDLPLDISHLLHFYHKFSCLENIENDIRNYAESNLTWPIKLNPVVDCFRNILDKKTDA